MGKISVVVILLLVTGVTHPSAELRASAQPQPSVQSLVPNPARDRWILEDVAVIGDDEQSDHWSELVIESAQRIVWTGRRVTDGADPRSAPISFSETWTRTGG